MKHTANSNFEEIITIKTDIEWIKKGILGVFATILINIVITVIT